MASDRFFPRDPFLSDFSESKSPAGYVFGSFYSLLRSARGYSVSVKIFTGSCAAVP